LGESWKLSGAILGAFLKDFLTSGGIYENNKKLRKTYGFLLIFEVPGRIGCSKNTKKLKKRRQDGLKEANRGQKLR